MKKNVLLAIILSLIAAACGGLGPALFYKIGAESNGALGATQIVWIFYLVAGLLACLLDVMFRRFSFVQNTGKQGNPGFLDRVLDRVGFYPIIIIKGLLSGALILSYVKLIGVSSAGEASLVFKAGVPFSIYIGIKVFNEIVRSKRILGMGVLAVTVGLIIYAFTESGIDGQSQIGIEFLMYGGVLMASSTFESILDSFLARRTEKRKTYIAATAMVIAIIVPTIDMCFQGISFSETLGNAVPFAISLLVLGTVTQGLAGTIDIFAYSLTSHTLVRGTRTVSIFFTLMFSFAFGVEDMSYISSSYFWIGCILILVGVIVSNYGGEAVGSKEN